MRAATGKPCNSGLAVALLATAICFAGTARAQEIPYEVKVNYSLAAENFKNEDYESALPYLRWLLTNAPAVYNGERIHRRAVKTYESMASSTEDEETKMAYLDSALHVLNTAIPTLKEHGAAINEQRWHLDWGNFLMTHRSVLPDGGEQPVDHFMQAFELDPAKLDAYYARLIVQEYARLEMKQEAVDFMDLAEPNYEDNEEAIAFFNSMRDQLFKSPEERITFLEGRLDKDPENLEIVDELFNLYRAMEMTDNMEEIGQRLLQMNPTATTYRLMAEVKYENGDYDGAIALNQSALELAGDDTVLKRDIHYNMALSYYSDGKLPAARNHARRALNEDASFGRAHLLIGDIYVKAVAGSSFEREDKAVYWLALDKYSRAKSVDPSLAEIADGQISRYRQYMPTTEEKFFKGWQSGDSYAVDYGRYAWIGETTTVR